MKTWVPGLALLVACGDDEPREGCTLQDLDGDSFYAGCGIGVDCDDADPASHPMAADAKGDGIDQDCDGVDGAPPPEPTLPTPPDPIVDVDGDGWSRYVDCDDKDPLLNNDDWDGDGATTCGGDCDDLDSDRHPDAPHVCGNALDDDCDGFGDCEWWGEVLLPDAAFAWFVPGLSLPGRSYGSGQMHAGDVTGDGVSDVLIDYDGVTDAIYVIPGPVTGGVDLVADSVAVFDWPGAFRTFAVGDLDGDGTDDLAISSYFDLFTPGVVEYFYGPFAGTYTRADAAASITPAEVNDAWGPTEMADLDGDGGLDVILGEPNGVLAAYPGFGGYAFVLFGPKYGVHGSEAHDVVVRGEDPAHDVGNEVSVGDLDGDGTPDLAVGVSDAYDTSLGSDGHVYVLPGPFVTGTRLLADEILVYDTRGDNFGAMVEASRRVGGLQRGADVDGDGYGDLVAGTGIPAYYPFASDGLRVVPGPIVGDVDADVGATGTVVTDQGISSSQHVCVLDANGDGVTDILASSPEGAESVTLLVYGPVVGTVDAADQGAVFLDPNVEGVGKSVSCPGDLDRDGTDDLLLSAEVPTEDLPTVFLVPGLATGW